MSYTERACAVDLSLQYLLRRLVIKCHLTSAFSQRLRKYKFTAVHMKTHKRRIQIYPLWRAFSNLSVYGERFHRLRVDGRPKRIKKFAFTSVCVYNRLRVDGVSVIGSKFSRQFFNQSKLKPKPIVTRACTFSRALCWLRVITSSFDWFTGLSPSFLIGQSNYFGFGFTTLD